MPENKEVRKLELCDIAPYLSYGLRLQGFPYYDLEAAERKRYDVSGVLVGLFGENCTIQYMDSKGGKWSEVSVDKLINIKPYLRPLDQLTQEITHNGEKLVFTELFETGDDVGHNYEFDFGNVKLINHLKTIAEHNLVADVPYLPHLVIKEMLKYHFDISGLCDSGLAIPIHNTK